MNISKNIQWITSVPEQWNLYRNRSYQVKLQKADVSHIYHEGGEPGVVYNYLERSYEKVNENGYVVTGLMQEMWPIGPGALKKYDIDPDAITNEPQLVSTRETDTVYAAIRIPEEIGFALETDYGEKAWLKGNAQDVPHDGGDFVLVCARLENGRYVPDFEDGGRIVNGHVFDKLYSLWDNS